MGQPRHLYTPATSGSKRQHVTQCENPSDEREPDDSDDEVDIVVDA
jgi:hypothetical protein